MNQLLDTVEQFFLKYNLQTYKNIAVGFSGGYDSMCLLKLSKILAEKYGFNLYALHLNHNWRGEESLVEQRRCEEFCKKENINFYTEILSDDCIKTETMARQYRYEFFDKCIEKFLLDAILTAHNANDNAETLLYRISKGTGIVGLRGIAEVRDKFYRPLLSVKRSIIEDFCKNNELVPNSDSSNFNTKYKRNLIRQDVLPVLEKINPTVVDAINSFSDIAKQENSIIEEYVNIVKSRIFVGEKILTKEYEKLSVELKRRIIYQLICDNNIDYDSKTVAKLVDFIEQNCKNLKVKKISLNKDKFLNVNSEKVWINQQVIKNDLEIIVDKEGKYEFGDYIFEIEKCSCLPKNFPNDAEKIAYCNFYNIDFPFVLRTRRDGDYFYPLGLNGKQKIKKYFCDKKIPAENREEIILLAKKSEILWIAGYCLSDKIKVKDECNYVLRLSNKRG